MVWFIGVRDTVNVVVEAENSPKPRKKQYKAETWPDDEGLCIELSNKWYKVETWSDDKGLRIELLKKKKKAP